MRWLPVWFSLALVTVACSSEAGSGNSGDGDGGDGDGETTAGDGDVDPNAVGPGSFSDALSPSPALEVPGIAASLAEELLAATTLNAAYDVTLNVLAEGGVATQYSELVKRAAKDPVSSTFVFPTSAVDLALEASARETMATYTLLEFAQMMQELGWPVPAGMTPQAVWLKLLAGWYGHAKDRLDAPDSFAILFIAAMNQRQNGPANIAIGTEDPGKILLSELEVELLVAAFDRTLSVPKGRLKRAIPKADTTPCSDFVKQAGVLGQAGQILTGEVVGEGIGEGLTAVYGAEAAGQLGTGLSVLGTASKIGKVIQQFRYGFMKLALDTPSFVQKPIKDAANKQGKLTATAGVDPMEYAEKVAAQGGPENSADNQARADCFNSLNLPTPTDARDIAADAENWRVSWSMIAGGDSQVRWSPGSHWDILSRRENKMTRLSDTTVSNSVTFDILPQASKATVGKQRMRQARFKAQLRRGGLPDLSTLWGSGKAGAAAAFANPIGAALGLADAVTEISTKWILEGMSPSAYVTQNLMEIEPTGLVGTISWTIHGSAQRHEGAPYEYRTLVNASIHQTGLLEVVSQKDEEATVYGSETCLQSYNYGHEQAEIVEGSEIVGERVSRTVRKYHESWLTTPPALEEGERPSLAVVNDPSASLEDLDPSLIPDYLRDMLSKITIFLHPAAGCGVQKGHLEEAYELYSYENGAWQQDSGYANDPVDIVPVTLRATMLELMREPGKSEIIGSNTQSFDHALSDITVPVTQTLEWNLHYIE